MPTTFVVKIRPDSEEARAAEAKLNGFFREVRFYAEVATGTDARLTHVYFADANPDSAVIVMEDLSHFKGGDQVVGLSHKQVRGVIDAIAPIHAAYWDSAKLSEFDWAPDVDHFNLDSFEAAWPEFMDIYGLRIGADARELGKYLATHIDKLEAKVAARPHTVVHGDLRADNILFGEDENDGDVIILDWQLIMRNLAALDIARLYGGSEPIQERSGHHREIAALWHEALIAGGVKNYSEEEAWEDFRLAALHCVSIPVKVHALFSKTSAKRGAQLRDAMAERFFNFAVEMDALSAL
ncbi:MAG: oxidoreductase family protein [Pseudomonadota bacterium]